MDPRAFSRPGISSASELQLRKGQSSWMLDPGHSFLMVEFQKPLGLAVRDSFLDGATVEVSTSVRSRVARLLPLGKMASEYTQVTFPAMQAMSSIAEGWPRNRKGSLSRPQDLCTESWPCPPHVVP